MSKLTGLVSQNISSSTNSPKLVWNSISHYIWWLLTTDTKRNRRDSHPQRHNNQELVDHFCSTSDLVRCHRSRLVVGLCRKSSVLWPYCVQTSQTRDVRDACDKHSAENKNVPKNITTFIIYCTLDLHTCQLRHEICKNKLNAFLMIRTRDTDIECYSAVTVMRGLCLFCVTTMEGRFTHITPVFLQIVRSVLLYHRTPT